MPGGRRNRREARLYELAIENDARVRHDCDAAEACERPLLLTQDLEGGEGGGGHVLALSSSSSSSRYSPRCPAHTRTHLDVARRNAA
jgi:hypothetical protein